MDVKYFTFLFLLLLTGGNSIAQDVNEPVNSNYLIAHGISPRVLDAAASGFIQDGRFDVEVTIEKDINGEKKSHKFLLVYDPEYKEGMDIRIISESDNLTKKEKKRLRKYIELSHYFSRNARNYLYDESTLKFLRREGNTVVLGFSYQKKDIDQYLANIKRLKGEIYITDGILDKVVLRNIKPLKKHIVQYSKTVKYARVEGGGYIVIWSEENMTQSKKKKVIKTRVEQITRDYRSPAGAELSWKEKTNLLPLQPLEGDTFNVKLGGPLPLMGKPATKLGYQLPRPVGMAVFGYNHDQLMDFTGLEVSFDGGQWVNLQNVFALDDSKVNQISTIYLAKADVWIFPFLNVMALAGAGINDLKGELIINEDLRDFLNSLPGWIIDIPNLPPGLPINNSVTSEVYGGGATLAGGAGNVILTVNYQLLFTKIVEANTTNMVNIVTPMLGYNFPIGFSLMGGMQGQFYNTQLTGFFILKDGDGNEKRLDYKVDFEPIKWNGILGMYIGFNKHLEMSVQMGFGQRKSLTAIFGYRF